MSEISTNYVPFPTVNSLLSSHSFSSFCFVHNNHAEKIVNMMFEKCSADCYVNKGKYMACGIIFRGLWSPSSANVPVTRLKTNRNIKFVEWCPTGFKCGINNTKHAFSQKIHQISVMMMEMVKFQLVVLLTQLQLNK